MLTFPPDITFLVQLVSFFILLWILNRLLFAPFGAVLAERTEQTEGASKAAAADRTRAESLSRGIEEGLAESRRQAMTEAEAIRREAREKETAIFNAAKQDAAARLSSLRTGIDKERAEAERVLRDDAKTLAKAMVDAVLTPVARKDAR